MFECSANAGSAGNYQWGLDAGPHQNDWNPYEFVPFEWDDGTYEPESENEIQVCIRFFFNLLQLITHQKGWTFKNDLTPPPTPPPVRPQPKARPIKKPNAANHEDAS